MIERKKKICKGCNTPQFIWARGCCRRCDPGKQKPQEDKAQEAADDKHLNEFYSAYAKMLPKHCENCDKPLQAYTPSLQRCVTAHIFPKSTFESVKTNVLNVMALGVLCGCHGRWDNTDAETRKTMPCYALALYRVAEFKDQLTDKEIVQAEKYLGIEL